MPDQAGRGSRARTCDLRFWRPPLYQLSYARIRRHSDSGTCNRFLRAASPIFEDIALAIHRMTICVGGAGLFQSDQVYPSMPKTGRPHRPSPIGKQAATRSTTGRDRAERIEPHGLDARPVAIRRIQRKRGIACSRPGRCHSWSRTWPAGARGSRRADLAYYDCRAQLRSRPSRIAPTVIECRDFSRIDL